MFKFLKKTPKLEVFVRHCYYSDISQHKERLPGFSHEKCHENLLETADFKKVNFTFFLDTARKQGEEHFIKNQHKYPVIEINSGTEAEAFLAMLGVVADQPFSEETIIYFLEDDYLHREGWDEVLREGLSIDGIDYVTLFDHRDKYLFPEYKNLRSKIFHTKSCHWRTTPSTTNTYAMHFGTLKKDLEIHREFSQNRKISADHEKFLKLGERGATLISSIPGFSTHVEVDFQSPGYNWEKYLQRNVTYL